MVLLVQLPLVPGDQPQPFRPVVGKPQPIVDRVVLVLDVADDAAGVAGHPVVDVPDRLPEQVIRARLLVKLGQAIDTAISEGRAGVGGPLERLVIWVQPSVAWPGISLRRLLVPRYLVLCQWAPTEVLFGHE